MAARWLEVVLSLDFQCFLFVSGGQDMWKSPITSTALLLTLLSFNFSRDNLAGGHHSRTAPGPLVSDVPGANLVRCEGFAAKAGESWGPGAEGMLPGSLLPSYCMIK